MRRRTARYNWYGKVIVVHETKERTNAANPPNKRPSTTVHTPRPFFIGETSEEGFVFSLFLRSRHLSVERVTSKGQYTTTTTTTRQRAPSSERQQPQLTSKEVAAGKQAAAHDTRGRRPNGTNEINQSTPPKQHHPTNETERTQSALSQSSPVKTFPALFTDSFRLGSENKKEEKKLPNGIV